MNAGPEPSSEPPYADEGWTTVAANRPPPSSLKQSHPDHPNFPQSPGNQFVALGDSDYLSPDCNSIPLPPNPLTDKLKIIEEKECRDLKLKAIEDAVGSPFAKRRNKGRGENPQLNFLYVLCLSFVPIMLED